MHKFIIMGIQGSGKGMQAKILAEDLELEHISVGVVLRWMCSTTRTSAHR